VQNKHIFEGNKYFKQSSATYAHTRLLRSHTLSPTGLVNGQDMLWTARRLRQLYCGLGSQRMFGRFQKIWKYSAQGRRWKEWAGNHFLADDAITVRMKSLQLVTHQQ